MKDLGVVARIFKKYDGSVERIDLARDRDNW